MMTSGFATRLALATIMAATVSAPAFAAGRLAVFSACRQDYRAKCSDIPLGGGRAAACLSEHRNELSPACRAAVTGGEAAASTADAKPGAVRRDLA